MSVNIRYVYRCDYCGSEVVRDDPDWCPGMASRVPSIPFDDWNWVSTKLVCPKHKIFVGEFPEREIE